MTKIPAEIDVKVTNQKQIDNLNRSLGGLGSAAKLAAGALATVGAVQLVRGFANTGREIQNLQVRFKFLFGSAEEGARAFDTLTQFASKVPFSLAEISAASGNLAVVSSDANELGKNLELAANIAAVAGIDIKTAGEQLQRALSGGIASADILRERGITALLGFKQGVTVTAAETAEAINKEFGPGGRFGQAANTLANTFEGVLSMLGDKFFNFQKVVGESFVDALQTEFGRLDQVLAQNQEQIDVIARTLGTVLANAVRTTADAVKFLADNSQLLTQALSALIALKLFSYFIKAARGLQAMYVATTGLIALTGPVGWGLIAAAAVAATAAYVAAGKVIDNIANSTEQAADKSRKYGEQLKFINGEYEALVGSSSKAAQAEAKANKQRMAAAEEIRKKYKTFIEQVQFLNEDSLETSLRIERERIAKLEELRKVDVDNYQKYTDLIREVEQKGSDERKKIYEDETKKQIEEQKKKLEAIRAAQDERLRQVKDGNIKDVDFTKATEKERREITIAQASRTLDALASQNKKFFELQKAVAITQAVINTYQGATKAFAQGGVLGFITAGLVIAAGLAQVAAIRSQTYPGRRYGGNITPGRAYTVGEEGPETFVPTGAGRVVPNGEMGGAQSVNVTFNINTVDAQGFDQLLRTRQGTIVGLINQALNEKGRRALT